MVDLRGFEPLTSSMPWRRAPSYATGPWMLVISWRVLSVDVLSLYAVTGVPASVRHAKFLNWFTLAAHRRVRSGVVALHHPAALCKGWTYYSCSLLVVWVTNYTIPQLFAICKVWYCKFEVEMRGLEPLTSTVRLSRSPS